MDPLEFWMSSVASLGGTDCGGRCGGGVGPMPGVWRMVTLHTSTQLPIFGFLTQKASLCLISPIIVVVIVYFAVVAAVFAFVLARQKYICSLSMYTCRF